MSSFVGLRVRSEGDGRAQEGVSLFGWTVENRELKESSTSVTGRRP